MLKNFFAHLYFLIYPKGIWAFAKLRRKSFESPKTVSFHQKQYLLQNFMLQNTVSQRTHLHVIILGYYLFCFLPFPSTLFHRDHAINPDNLHIWCFKGYIMFHCMCQDFCSHFLAVDDFSLFYYCEKHSYKHLCKNWVLPPFLNSLHRICSPKQMCRSSVIFMLSDFFPEKWCHVLILSVWVYLSPQRTINFGLKNLPLII